MRTEDSSKMPLTAFARSVRLAFAAALAFAGVAHAQSAKTVLLLKDGSWIECAGARIESGALVAESAAGSRSLARSDIDPLSWLIVRAADLERGKRTPTVRERHEIAADFRAAGAQVLGRRQILLIAESKPALARAAAFWLTDYPDSAAGRFLADGLSAFHSGRPLDAFQHLSSASADADAPPALAVAARRFLRALVRILEDSSGLDPGSGPGEDLARNGRLSRIRSGILEAGKAVAEAEQWLARGNPPRALRGFEIARETLESSASDCAKFEADRPGRWYEDQASRLRAWAMKELLDVHVRTAEFHLERKDQASAMKSVEKALEIDPNDARVIALRDRIEAPGRKRG